MERNALKEIRLAEVSDAFPYRSRYRLEDHDLTQSVKRYGVVYPIFVTQGRPKTIVAGHKRFLAARKLHHTHIPAVLMTAPLASRELYLLSLLSNWNQILTDMDRLWGFRKAWQGYHFTEEDLKQEILPLLGLPGRHHLVTEFKKILSLDKSLLQQVADGKVPFRGAGILADFSKGDQKVFARRIGEKVLLNSNQLLQTVEWMKDLLRSKETSLASFVKGNHLDDILNHPVWDKRLKANRFFEKVRKLRHPRLARHENRFEKYFREIHRESRDIKVEGPPFYEEEGFVLRAKVRDAEAFDGIMRVLSKKRDAIRSFFKIVL